MNRKIRRCLALTAVLVAPLGAAGPNPRITVLIYNYAAIPSEVLAQTEAEATRIYRACHIQICWLDCPLSPSEADRFPACQLPSGPTWLALRILSQPMAERSQRAQESFGFALYPDDGSFATIANVFPHDAEQLAKSRGIPEGVILGHVVSHELGHLLLGPRSHSRCGIMHSPWHPTELEIIERGLMMFTPWEAERMRASIRARIAEQRVAEVPLVPRM